MIHELPPAVFRYIEHELYNYTESMKLLKQKQDDIIFGNKRLGRPARGRVSDPTAIKGIKLASPAMVRIERTVKAIEKAYSSDQRLFYIFVLKYQERKPWQEVCNKLHISERSFYRYRRQLVTRVAEDLGHIV